MKKNIALFHPWIKSRGGAEKVILELLSKSKHSFDVYTWAYDPKNTFPEFKKFNINVLTPKIGKRLARSHLLRGLFFPLSFLKKIPLEKYDKTLISTSGLAEFITFRNYKKGQTYAYVHTPLREADEKIIKWNLKNRYRGKFLTKYLYLFAVGVYRVFEKIAWKKLDVIMFNSELSLSRAEKRNLLIGQKKHVVYPPIDFERLKVSKAEQKKRFFYISRFNPPKRQDVLIEAWKIFSKKHPGYELVLAGTSDNKKYLKSLQKLAKGENSIKIKAHLSDKEMGNLIESSMAGIFLGYQEDFGIVPLEVLAAGKPLIAVDEGGYVNLIKDHKGFYKIKERHGREEMIKEVVKGLSRLISTHKGYKKMPKLKTKDFVKEIDSILE